MSCFHIISPKYRCGCYLKILYRYKNKNGEENLDMLQHEADSLRNLLRGAIFLPAKVYDYTYNLNPAFQAYVRRTARSNECAGGWHGLRRGVEKFELAKITLQKKHPYTR